MPFTLTVDPVNRLVRSSASGTLTAAELVEHQRQLRLHPDFQPTFDQIADLSAVRQFAGDSGQIVEVAREPLFAPTARRAIVAPQDEIFGLARLYEIVHDGKSIVRIFRDRAEAAVWLNHHADGNPAPG